MSGKEKLYFLLNRIDDQRVLTPSGQPILIHPIGDLRGYYPDLELLMLLKKLQDDLKVLKVTRTPLSDEERGYDSRYEDYYFGLELLPTFDEYFTQIQNEPEYQNYSSRKPASTKPPETQPTPSNSTTDIVYEITYTPSREILLNKTYQLAKPNFNTENDLVFTFLYKNPHKTYTRVQLEEQIKTKLTKDFHKIVENLGFKGDLRRMFFSVSETSITFKNPITQEDLEALGIQKIKIS